MSHANPVFSAPGTPIEDQTVGEIVAKRPSQSRIFESYDIDFCCNGGLTLAEACEKHGIAQEEIAAKLIAEAETTPEHDWNPAELPMDQMIEYIIKTHHDRLRSELPRLQELANKVARVHGGHTPSLHEVRDVFERLNAETFCHISKEEESLFPAILRQLNGEEDAIPLDGPIAKMLQEHDDTGEDMEELKELTNGFQAPPEACNSYRALFAGLAEMERDMHSHIHLENSVLFPAALAMASA